MKYAINTVLFPPDELKRALTYARELGVMLEILPFWHEDSFCRFMDMHMTELQGLVSSFHEPFYRCEHTAPKGTSAHREAIEGCRKTYEYAAKLNAKHIVFHHNNDAVSPNTYAEQVTYAAENLQECNEIAAEYGLHNLVENAGAIAKNTMLFDQEAFITLFDKIDNDCLIDLGHVHCNGWDVERIISALETRIRAYHIHDNNGREDAHLPLGQGSLDMPGFLTQYKKHTPGAMLILEYGPSPISISQIRTDFERFE